MYASTYSINCREQQHKKASIIISMVYAAWCVCASSFLLNESTLPRNNGAHIQKLFSFVNGGDAAAAVGAPSAIIVVVFIYSFSAVYLCINPHSFDWVII